MICKFCESQIHIKLIDEGLLVFCDCGKHVVDNSVTEEEFDIILTNLSKNE